MDSSNNEINIDELESMTLLLLAKLKESNGNTVKLNNDYYWDIDENELYNPYETPKDIGLGQLSFDIEQLQGSKKNDTITTYDLKKLGAIFIALSEDSKPL